MTRSHLATTPPRLVAEALCFARNDEPVFGPLDFTLDAGEALLIEGGNGSGKTTLLRIVAGMLVPTSGSLRLDGETLDVAALAGRTALLGHAGGLKRDLTVAENLRFAVGLAGLAPGTSIAEALGRVGLAGYGDVALSHLSAGQGKRVALARLVLTPARLWLLDEPFANLDLDGIRLVNALLDEHVARGGAALVTSHGAYALTTRSQRRLLLDGPMPAVTGAPGVATGSASVPAR
ncbi:MAG: heme ABC exporter ATP-binding protein CcmA [Lysobacterales bacterium]